MVRKLLRRALLAAIPLTLVTAAAPAGAAVSNGNFETGTLAGWLTHEESDNGAWVTYTGSTAPLSGNQIHSPPQGTYAATTDSLGGPGTHILYRDIALPADTLNTLAFTVYYDNQNGTWITPSPNTLNHDGAPNQQFRIDIIKPGAPIKTLSSGDILNQVFRTTPSDPATMEPTRFIVDVSALAGQTVRLRFAAVDNQFFLHASVDDVALLEQVASETTAFPVIAEVVPDAQVYLKFSARLESESGPVAGETIDFLVGPDVACSAKTNAQGIAECGSLDQELEAALSGGYQAVFAGTNTLLPSQDRGPVLILNGTEI